MTYMSDRIIDCMTDHIKTTISLAVVTVISIFTNPKAMFWSLSSYLLVLLAFIEFVIWNGGVVLGKWS